MEQVEHRTGATELRDALGAAMRIFIRRMIGAALLSRRVYEAVEADRHATGQALAVVLLASVGTGVGWVGVEPGRAWAMVVLDRCCRRGLGRLGALDLHHRRRALARGADQGGRRRPGALLGTSTAVLESVKNPNGSWSI